MLDEHSTLTSTPAESRHPFAHAARWFSPKLIVGLALGALAVEGAIRLLEARSGSFLVADRGIAALHEQALTDAEQQFDLIAVGSSSTGAAMWMPELEAAGAACDGYVAWLPTTNIEELAAFVSETVLPNQTPDEIVVSLTMREFVITEEYRVTQSEPTADSDAMEWAKEHIALIRGRNTLQAPDRVGAALRDVLVEQLTVDGNQLVTRNRFVADESGEHRQQEIDYLGQFRMDTAVFAELDGLLAAAAAAGLDTTVVNVPVSDLFIEMAPNGRFDYDAYVSAIAESADRSGANFVDLGEVDGLDQAADFADVNHLNASGATKFTAALAERLGSCTA